MNVHLLHIEHDNSDAERSAENCCNARRQLPWADLCFYVIPCEIASPDDQMFHQPPYQSTHTTNTLSRARMYGAEYQSRITN